MLLQLAQLKEYQPIYRAENKVFRSINLSLQRKVVEKNVANMLLKDSGSGASDGQMQSSDEIRIAQDLQTNVQRLINGRERFVDC